MPPLLLAELAVLTALEGSGLESADVAVIAAMSGWVYEPTLVNGTAVPIVTSSTITFTFR